MKNTFKPETIQRIKEAAAKLQGPGGTQALAYLIDERGLSPSVIEEYGIGYAPFGAEAALDSEPGKVPPKTKSRDGAHAYRLIFPFPGADGTPEYFMMGLFPRPENPIIPKYLYLKGTPRPIFNERYVSGQEVPRSVFIVEGVIDALSIESAGGKAIAMGGTGKAKELAELVETWKPKTTFIIVPDWDEAGLKAGQALLEALQGAGARAIVATDRLYPGCKDANDVLTKAPAGTLKAIVRRLEEEAESQAVDKMDALIKASQASQGAMELWAEIHERAVNPAISTGLPGVDELLGGGIRPGLYIVGAESSVGKTSFCLQLADTFSEHGQPVIFFSLEMARTELVAKSVSRLTQRMATGRQKGARGLSTREILDLTGMDESSLAVDAIGAYGSKIGENLYIVEGGQGCETIADFTAITEHLMGQLEGKRPPVVFVDYLQIIRPADLRASDKQNADRAVTELKRLSRALKTPVIVISSLNRMGYGKEISMASFKESGGIEYSADILIGLNYRPIEEMNQTTRGKEADGEFLSTKEEIREQQRMAAQGGAIDVTLKVLKNRNGQRGQTNMKFLPKYNLFLDH